jgi:hypothetical protein
VGSPLPTPSSQIEPTMRITNCRPCYTTLPRTRNRATGGKPPSSFRARPVFPPRSAGSPAVWPQRRFFSPLSLASGPSSDAVTLAAAPFPPRSWAAAGPKVPQRALAPGVGQKSCPRPSERISLFFLFHPFSHLNSFLNILCIKNYQKGFPRSHKIMLLENGTL